MTTKQFFLSLLTLLAAAVVAAAVAFETPWGDLTEQYHAQKSLVVPPLGGMPAKAGTTNARSAKAGASSTDVAIAAQTARLGLSDGRTATFAFASTTGTLTAHAAVGLDQECNYALLPLADTLPPAPTPSPSPAPQPNPPQPRPPAPQPSNLRVLFIYDPAALTDLPFAQQAILASPALRTYLEKHCPLESNCANGVCPLAQRTQPRIASYPPRPTYPPCRPCGKAFSTPHAASPRLG